MDVNYRDELARQAPVQEATKRLEEVLGPSAARVNAEWERVEDERGNSSYRLRISDGLDDATAILGPTELTVPLQLRIRLYHLWGDLLQARNDRQLRNLSRGEE